MDNSRKYPKKPISKSNSGEIGWSLRNCLRNLIHRGAIIKGPRSQIIEIRVNL